MATGAARDRVYPPKPSDVYLFATCLVDQFAPEAGLATVQLLEHEGIRVHFPEQQTCCGQPAYNSGYPDEARAVALQQLNLFPEPWPVVVPSGSLVSPLMRSLTLKFGWRTGAIGLAGLAGVVGIQGSSQALTSYP